MQGQELAAGTVGSTHGDAQSQRVARLPTRTRRHSEQHTENACCCPICCAPAPADLSASYRGCYQVPNRPGTVPQKVADERGIKERQGGAKERVLHNLGLLPFANSERNCQAAADRRAVPAGTEYDRMTEYDESYRYIALQGDSCMVQSVGDPQLVFTAAPSNVACSMPCAAAGLDTCGGVEYGPRGGAVKAYYAVYEHDGGSSA